MPEINDLTMRELCDRFRVKRWTIHRWINELGFPKPKVLAGVKGGRWSVAAVDQWEVWRVTLAQRDRA